MPFGYLFHRLHDELVLIICGVGVGIDRGHFVLGRGDLVMLGFGQNAELPQFFIQILHILGNARTDNAKVVVVEFLTFRRLCTEQCPAAETQILALFKHLFINKEILLLRADLRRDLLNIFIAEQMQNAHCFTADSLHRTKQRSLFVERRAAVGAEHSRDAQAAIL